MAGRGRGGMRVAMGLKDFFIRPTPEELVREHGPRVRCLLLRIFGRGADVDDVFQNVFVEAMRTLPLFEGRSKLSTWIHRVTLNVAYQEMRQQYGRKRVVALEDEHEATTAASADVFADVAREQAARRVHAALHELPPKQRIAVTFHYFEGMSLRAIADELGLPLQTVASQVRYGRARLADALAEHHGAPQQMKSREEGT